MSKSAAEKLEAVAYRLGPAKVVDFDTALAILGESEQVTVEIAKEFELIQEETDKELAELRAKNEQLAAAQESRWQPLAEFIALIQRTNHDWQTDDCQYCRAARSLAKQIPAPPEPSEEK